MGSEYVICLYNMYTVYIYIYVICLYAYYIYEHIYTMLQYNQFQIRLN